MTEEKKTVGWLQKPWVKWAIPLIGLVGIVLIGLSEWWPDSSPPAAGIDTAAYTEQLETRLEQLVGRIQGAGDCRVMVTLENGVEYRYADDQTTDSAYSEENGTTNKKNEIDHFDSTVVLSDGGGLLITEIEPTVRGAVVVCAGGGDETVKTAVTAAVATALNISTRRVCVLPAA